MIGRLPIVSAMRGSPQDSPHFLFLHFCLTLFIAGFFPFLPACSRPEPVSIRPASSSQEASEKRAGSAVLIVAVGDIMMPLSIQKAAMNRENGYDLVFEKIKTELAGADITIANLETPVDHESPVSGYPRFNAHPPLLAAMKKAGVTIVSVANNHAMDRGVEGLKRTLDNIERAGLLSIGAGRTRGESSEIRFVNIRGLNAAFLAYTYDTNEGLPRKKTGAPGITILRSWSDQDLSLAAATVRQARVGADLVVVSIHWGEEYATEPSAWQRRVAAELVEAGADIILGHHPHVLQPIESIPALDGRAGLVAFSLGNFVSTQNAGISYANSNHHKALTGDGIILTMTVVKESGRARVSRAEFLPIWTLRDTVDRKVLYRPVSLSREIALREAQRNTAGEDDVIHLLNTRRQRIIQTVSRQGQ
jgi:poly-gamma-glutamate synthesis protein (capsule biosynthesis protein)